MKTRKYLTEAQARALKKGARMVLGYDDFNRGVFDFTFDCVLTRPGPNPVRVVGLADYHDGDKPFIIEMYVFSGHRDGSRDPIVCSGSGAERVFVRTAPKAWARRTGDIHENAERVRPHPTDADGVQTMTAGAFGKGEY